MGDKDPVLLPSDDEDGRVCCGIHRPGLVARMPQLCYGSRDSYHWAGQLLTFRGYDVLYSGVRLLLTCVFMLSL